MIKLFFPRVAGRTNRVRFSALALALVGLAGITTAALALQQYIRHSIRRTGNETRANVILYAPYGSLLVAGGTPAGILTSVESNTDESTDNSLQVRYGLQSNSVGNLRISIGSDQGMRQRQLATAWKASAGLSAVRTNYRSSDDGRVDYYGAHTPDLHGEAFPPAAVPVSEGYRSKVLLTREIPLSITAQLGFGESLLDLTGLALGDLHIETAASKSQITVKSPNPTAMSECRISAGVGECSVDGISNLNATFFQFGGGLGYYNLSFNGKLARDLESVVSVGLGKVSITIPPSAGRVQIYYDEGFFSSFQFKGLNTKRAGYATSVGFDRSTAPILTLRLSTGMGKIVVNYR